MYIHICIYMYMYIYIYIYTYIYTYIYMGGLVYSVNSVSGREYSAPRLPRHDDSAGGWYETGKPDAVISLAENLGRLRVCYISIQEQRRGPRDSGAARATVARGAVPRGPPRWPQEDLILNRSFISVRACRSKPACQKYSPFASRSEASDARLVWPHGRKAAMRSHEPDSVNKIPFKPNNRHHLLIFVKMFK